MAAYNVTLEDVRSMLPPGARAKDDMVRWVGAHIVSRPNASVQEVASDANVPYGTARRWNSLRWVKAWVQSAYILTTGDAVVEVWNAIKRKALEGNITAAKVYLKRHDPRFDGIPEPTPTPTDAGPTDDELTGAEHVSDDESKRKWREKKRELQAERLAASDPTDVANFRPIESQGGGGG